MRIQLVPAVGRPDFLDLPWHQPLEEWDNDRLVVAARGIGTHVVRFVDYDGALYALKELPPAVAQREYGILRGLVHEGIPAVEGVGIVRERAGDLPEVLITRYLDYALPCRLVIARELVPGPLDRLLDAIAELLVRLHLGGFYWGDCSLSNLLVRRDAGTLAAYLVDAETSERHPQLSGGQRSYDLEIAEQNVFGELLDLEAGLGPSESRDPETVPAELRRRYDELWDELTAEEAFAPGDHRLEQRLRRLNELGFDVEEVDLVSTDEGYRLRVDPGVLEPGHHRRRLARLTGLEAQENQARRLLADLEAYRRSLDESGARPVSETAAAGRWLADVFEPAIAAVPGDLWPKRQAAELYHELLEHRWYLSEREGRDVGIDEAVRSYVDTVLRGLPDEKTLLPGPD